MTDIEQYPHRNPGLIGVRHISDRERTTPVMSDDYLDKMTQQIREQVMGAAHEAAGKVANHCAENLRVPEFILARDPEFRGDMRRAIVQGFVDALDKTWMGEK